MPLVTPVAPVYIFSCSVTSTNPSKERKTMYLETSFLAFRPKNKIKSHEKKDIFKSKFEFIFSHHHTHIFVNQVRLERSDAPIYNAP